MKNKRLLVILVVFLVLGTLAVLGGVLFSIKRIDVRFHNELDYFVDANASAEEKATQTKRLEDSILASLSYLNGKNILLNMSSKKIKNKIESHEGDYQGFRLRVTNVRAEFPNRLVVTVRERYPVYRYTIGGKTFVLDGGLRVLDDRVPKDLVNGVLTERRLIDLRDALPEISNDGLSIGDWLTAKPEDAKKQEVIEKLVPFFAREQSFEDAITGIFWKIEFKDHYLGEGSNITKETYFTLVMTQFVEDAKHNPMNYFVVCILDPDVKTLMKLGKVWQMVEYNKNIAGTYEIMDWVGPMPNSAPGVRQYAKDKLVGFYKVP